MSNPDLLEELLNEFKETQSSANLTSKQNLSLLKILKQDTPEFPIGEEPLGKTKSYDIELYLNVERPYPPMLRRRAHATSLETRKEIENTSMNS
ncbi:hypothetical protein O181_011529 [Austropuccinia psidii MF-1]|uniref:Uncharacterized protein n=1 Tax=Austropuccinia psidii MF-1 TaxID=1389203 RepID=A0A9Q3BUM1_9BASI|nr:hypothetical protein [Austropuccinia psidii MF-1]